MPGSKSYSARRWHDNPGFVMAQCSTCRNFKLGTTSCKAFAKIPRDILLNYELHDHPIDGDRGFRYEPKDHNAPKPVQRKKVMPYD